MAGDQPSATRPILVAAPVIVAVPAGLQLAVVGNGVRMPVVQTAEVAPAPVEDAVVDNGAGGAMAPTVPAAPAVPVYPRKQARH